jgi:hypothetical protein
MYFKLKIALTVQFLSQNGRNRICIDKEETVRQNHWFDSDPDPNFFSDADPDLD